MASLPNEIWIQILDYLEPQDLLSCQRVSTEMVKLARDSSLWRSKCFERAPSAVHAFSNGNTNSLSDLLNGLSLAGSTRTSQSEDANAQRNLPVSRRAKAIVKWDCTDANENIDWLSEYIARHAPLSTEWQHHSNGNEIRSMALFERDTKVLSAMEDGSLRIWDVNTSGSGRRSLRESGRSRASLLFDDLSTTSGPSNSRQPAVGTAVDSTVVDSARGMAYVAVKDVLNEIDLSTMQLVSQNKYAWSITATSQTAGPELPLMIGTSFSLQMHDPRLSLRYQADQTEHRLDVIKEEHNMVFLENYNKAEHRSKWIATRRASPGAETSQIPGIRQPSVSPSPGPEACARIEPGPQAILHRGTNEVIVAGRMPSILFYDMRLFPQLHYSIHSGARLSSIMALPHPPRDRSSAVAEATLIAAGEYHGRGSLELYELPHNRPRDRRLSQLHVKDDIPDRESGPPNLESQREPSITADPSDDLGIETSTTNNGEPGEAFSYRNRQSASKAKLLSVAAQGARIVFSDGDGGLRWVERDGRGLARRWNINSYEYTQAGGVVVGEAVARKILTFSSDQSGSVGSRIMTRGDGDLLVWTGSDIGIVTSKVKWTDHDELVKAFEEKMHLSDGPQRRQEQEEQYARIMRQALERQADERRFLARFGRTGGW